jgi:hypothetical protein
LFLDIDNNDYSQFIEEESQLPVIGQEDDEIEVVVDQLQTIATAGVKE